MVKHNQPSKKANNDTMFDNFLEYEAFFDRAKKIIPGIPLEQAVSSFHEEMDSFQSALNRFKKTVKETPLLIVFLDWVKEHRPNDLAVEHSNILMDNGLIQFINAKKEPIKLADLVHLKLEISKQIEVIRCQRQYSISDRENLVETFLNFFDWLSTQTASNTPVFEDPDKQRTENRCLSHDTFVHLLDPLDERSRIIAKLLYFGGDRTLDDAVTLNIKNVDFKNQQIDIHGKLISYPLHLFDDIKSLIGKRTSGAIFLGRNNTTINPSTIFRHFKEIGPILGLHDLSPKALTENR